MLDVETPGGKQKAYCWHTEGIFRLIQSIPSAKAEPFKRWLAKVGYERIQEIENPEEVTLIRLTVADLGFKSSATTDQIYERAQNLGLELCPADTGPNYRLKYRNQPLNEWIYMGMKQITDSGGDPDVFKLVRRDDGLWLDDRWAIPGLEWSPNDKFVFRLPARLASPSRLGLAEVDESKRARPR